MTKTDDNRRALTIEDGARFFLGVFLAKLVLTCLLSLLVRGLPDGSPLADSLWAVLPF